MTYPSIGPMSRTGHQSTAEQCLLLVWPAVGGLELLVRAHVMLEDRHEAEAALRELQGVVSNVSTGAMQAAVRFAEGRVAAMSDPPVAKVHFEDAAELFAYSGAPFESAEARVELGRILSALGRKAAAIDAILTAARTFDAIGASAQAHKAQSLARELRSSGGKRAYLLHGLTKREPRFWRSSR